MSYNVLYIATAYRDEVFCLLTFILNLMWPWPLTWIALIIQ